MTLIETTTGDGLTQRWRDRVGSYRPAREVLTTSLYEVAAIHDDTTARNFVIQHHYAASYPAARRRFGLYEGPFLVGVAVFSHPMNDAVLGRLPCAKDEAVELGRLVLLDRVPANAESWFLARAFDLLRRTGFRGVVSFSDPMARTDASGKQVFGGHAGVCYQASNAVYVGRAGAKTQRLLPDGTVLSARALSKIRAQDQGHRYAEELLVRAGAAPRRGEDPRQWVETWLPRVTRVQRHPGNFTYLFGLDKATKRHLPAGMAYPKLIAEAPSF